MARCFTTLRQALLVAAILACAHHGGGDHRHPSILLFARAHECIHDATDLWTEEQRMLDQGLTTQSYAHPMNVTPGGPVFLAANSQPIRIVVDDTGLTRAGSYCAAEGNVIPTYRGVGQTLTCTAADVLTTDKINILKTRILVPAIERVRNFVKVEPVSANLMVPLTACGDVPIPAAHNSTGVPNADLVVYLTSAPITGGAIMAFSGACRRDQSQRIVIGKLNVAASRIAWSDTDSQANEDSVKIIVHELMHVLGVSAAEMFRGDNKDVVFKRGRQVAVSTRAGVRAFTREYFNCSTLQGPEFENEGQGVSLSVSSHWERRSFFEEAMTSSYGTQISGLTLAFLNDINVGYTIDQSKAEPMYYGKDAGCGLHENLCTSVAGGQGTLFCNASADSTTEHCTYDFGAIGRCTAAVAFMDGCDVVVANAAKRCSVTSAGGADDIKYPHTFSPSSRCFQGQGVRRGDFTPSPANGPRCLESRCAGGAVEFKVPFNATYATCGSSGSLVAVPGSEYVGQVVCPVAADMCRALSTPATFIVPTTAVPPLTTTTTAAPTTTTTTLAPGQTTTLAPGATTTLAPGQTTTTTGATLAPGQTTTVPPGVTVTSTSAAPGQTTTLAPGQTTTLAPGQTLAPGVTTTAAANGTNGTTTIGANGTTIAPPPTPTTAAPTQPRNYTVVGTVVIAGDGFATIFANPAAWLALREAFLADLTAALGVNASQVTLTDVALAANGTGLSVRFTVVTTDPAQAAAIAVAVNRLVGSTSAFPLTTAQYKQANPTATNLTVTQATGSSSDFGSISSAMPVGMRSVIGLALAAVALVSFAL